MERWALAPVFLIQYVCAVAREFPFLKVPGIASQLSLFTFQGFSRTLNL